VVTHLCDRAAAHDPQRYGGSDYAVTSDGGDYTVHVAVAVDPDNRMYLLALWRGHTSSDVWIEAWCDLVRRSELQASLRAAREASSSLVGERYSGNSAGKSLLLRNMEMQRATRAV
jgi:hypothetical protein